MPPLTKPRWERFALAYFAGKSATESARIAGISRRSAVRLAQNGAVLARIRELQEAAASDKIMSVVQRKERLSEIIRARLTDFVECGPDGARVNIGLESANSAAIQRLRSRTEYDDDGRTTAVVTSLRLHDPIKAMAELNKMEGAYASARIAKGVAASMTPRLEVVVVSSEQPRPSKEC